MLSKAVKDNPDAELIELELQVLGVTHMELGVWLMEAWGLPSELIIAVREHHNPDYHDTHAVYPNLILVGNRLLKSFGMGDEITDALPDTVLRELGLTKDSVVDIFDMIVDNREGLDYMAMQMAA
jgi:HD-like signal output (HDOD) protein